MGLLLYGISGVQVLITVNRGLARNEECIGLISAKWKINFYLNLVSFFFRKAFETNDEDVMELDIGGKFKTLL